MSERYFGHIKDRRDERDYLLRAVKPKLIPDIVDLSLILPSVRDQGNQGSCVGHGIGGILTGKAIQIKTFTEWFSPRWIYYLGRFMGGYVNEDCGCEPRLALDGLLKSGCALESAWPYESDFDPSPPPDAAYRAAFGWPLLSYVRVVDGVDGLCTALADGNLVAIGSPWFTKWLPSPKDGKLPSIKCWDSVSGGHETLLYGYDKKAKYLKGLNSWGEDWGNDGKFLMPFSAITQFKKHGGYDSHIVRVNWTKLEKLMYNSLKIKIAVPV